MSSEAVLSNLPNANFTLKAKAKEDNNTGNFSGGILWLRNIVSIATLHKHRLYM